MYGYIEGFSDNDDINYCPSCGSDNLKRNCDGTAECAECGFMFGVIDTTGDRRDD